MMPFFQLNNGNRSMTDKEISWVNWLYFNKHQLIKLNTRGRASAYCRSAWSSSFHLSADHEKLQGSLEYLQEGQPNNKIILVVTWSVFLTFLQLNQLKEAFNTVSPSWFFSSLSMNQKIKISWKGSCKQSVSCSLSCRGFVNFLFNYGLQSWKTFIVKVHSILYLPKQGW